MYPTYRLWARSSLERKPLLISKHMSCICMIFDSETIDFEAMNFYQNLYGEDPRHMRNLPPSRLLKLDSCDIEFLGKFVTDDEIKIALFDMVLIKAPSSDGFHVLFFQKQWDTVGVAICERVKMVFNGGVIDAELNNTLIVLIPKVIWNEVPTSKFRPVKGIQLEIFLCYVWNH
ncbi:hypothetical protein J1N35_010586 [Gossypium stocksii]|uniref:Uncharacterized protein n=1 Tax=Gossypium stocksii TaxID=47602 RepID=A0A9D3W2M7_9ROSI|nr:hypothetical protein J1N35_010586 [Gossypium stocksii]